MPSTTGFARSRRSRRANPFFTHAPREAAPQLAVRFRPPAPDPISWVLHYCCQLPLSTVKTGTYIRQSTLAVVVFSVDFSPFCAMIPQAFTQAGELQNGFDSKGGGKMACASCDQGDSQVCNVAYAARGSRMGDQDRGRNRSRASYARAHPVRCN
jgi:hypothetical protein